MFDEPEAAPFALIDPDYYESLEHYTPRSRTYIRTVRRLLPDDWTMTAAGIWMNAEPPDARIPLQGFKIHISAIPRNGILTLRRVVPVLVQFRVTFKFLIDPYFHEYSHSKQYSRPQSGKFITAYPVSIDQFRELLKELHTRTRDLEGPYILSDFRYPDSRVLFYRYGGFHRSQQKLQVTGTRLPFIYAPDGETIPDRRNPYPEHPPWVEDPLGQELDLPDTVFLNDRYRITEVIQIANSGGVYRAIDTRNDREVIIKEARPYIGGTRRHPWDAVALLRHEFRVLSKLADTGWVPVPLDLFTDWEHTFLVETVVPGIPLRNFRASIELSPLLKVSWTPADVKSFLETFMKIYEQMHEALVAFHRRGIIMGDLSPSNVMVDPDTLKIQFIDFEGAYDPRDPVYIPLITPGFATRSRIRRYYPTEADDWFAFAMTLYSMILPVESLFMLHPGARVRFINEIIHDYGFPRALKQLLYTHIRGHDHFAKSPAQLTRPGKPPRTYRATNRHAIRQTLNGLVQEIIESMNPQRTDRLWPASPKVFETNPMNYSYGASGIALFLKQVLGDIPGEARQWIEKQPLSLDAYPPGLYVGLAGIAWALDLLGYHERAESVMRLSARSPLLEEQPDLFYGASGWGLAALYFYHRTGDPAYLDMADHAAEIVRRHLRSDDTGLFWEDTGERIFYGYAHGASGIAWFFLNRFRVTRDPADRETAERLLQYELAHAIHLDNAITWSYSNKDPTMSPYWRFGAAGNGSVFIRAYEILKDPRWLDAALRVAAYLSGKYAVAPGQFLGLSGIAEFFIDLYRTTQNPTHLKRAFQFARSILLYRIPRHKTSRGKGYAFPDVHLLRISHDFSNGSAGIGMFFLRLLEPMRPRALMDIETPLHAQQPLIHETAARHV